MSTVLLPHCSGRVTRGRCIRVAPLSDGRFLTMVLELAPVRIVTEAITETAPTREDQERFLEGVQ